MSHITIPSSSSALYDYVADEIVSIDTLTPIDTANEVKVFINGAWIGIAKDPIDLFRNLKQKKYSGIMNIYTSVVFDYRNKEIKICNDAGRLTFDFRGNGTSNKILAGTSAGNVGIGTTSPSSGKLVVSGAKTQSGGAL